MDPLGEIINHMDQLPQPVLNFLSKWLEGDM